jgi:hypothetical protein
MFISFIRILKTEHVAFVVERSLFHTLVRRPVRGHWIIKRLATSQSGVHCTPLEYLGLHQTPQFPSLKPRTHIRNEPERASTYKCEHRQTLTSPYAHKWIERRKHTAKFSVRWRSSRSLPKNTVHAYQTQTNTNSYFSLKNRQAPDYIRWCSISFVRARLFVDASTLVHSCSFVQVCLCLFRFVRYMCTRHYIFVHWAS